jgi:hypothetical protein
VLKVLDHMISEDDSAEVQRTIERHDRQINRLRGAASASAVALMLNHEVVIVHSAEAYADI